MYPVAISVVRLVLTLSAYADDGFDIFLTFGVEVPDVAAITQEEDVHRETCILVSRDRYGVEDLNRIVVDAENLGRKHFLARRTLFLQFHDLRVEGNCIEFGKRLVPELLKIRLCIGERYDIFWFEADGVKRFVPLSSPLLVGIIDDILSSCFDKYMVKAGCGDAGIDAKTRAVAFCYVDTLRNHADGQPRIGSDAHGDIGVQGSKQRILDGEREFGSLGGIPHPIVAFECYFRLCLQGQ